MNKVDSRLNVKISAEDKKCIEKKAQAKGLSLSSYVRLVLMEHK